MLTSRERLTRLFNGQDIDRVPIWLLAPYHRLSCYADIYNIPSYRKVTEQIDKYCDTFDRRDFYTGFCYNASPDVRVKKKERVENRNRISEEIVTYKDFKLIKSHSTGKDGTKIKFFVEDIDELMKILDMPYVPVEPDIKQYFIEKEELGDKGLMMIDIGDPLVPLHYLMNAENFSIFSLTEYDKILQFTDVMYKRVLNLYRYLLEKNVGEVFFIVGAEFAGPPMVSPSKFNEMSARYVKGICDLIREYGKKSIVHYHGNLFRVLDGMKEINPDGLHTIEAPPIGDCTIPQAREKLGSDLVLIGNIQYDDLTRKSKEEIDEMVKQAIEEGKTGRFILSPTAGPYEDYISEKMVENYLTFVEAGIKYGKL
ncbi:methylcobalamin:coenzyme M methyltransferase [Peptococcaceae bacterium CEB3]|nr:methylcobalamin:coenzyme M methyltransferase [Peptococcaceae bacterium CEB3]